jgi:hypothetical protein
MEPASMTALQSQAALIIQSWMHSNIKNKGYERFDDLHIDNIDRRWKAREFWIEGGFEAFRIAVDIRNQQAPNFTVVLAFALIAGKEPRGLNFHNLKQMKAELGSSPPSLYLFQKGREPWTDVGLRDRELVADSVVLKNVSCHSLGCPAEANSCQYMEFRQIDFDEYSRTLFIAG